MPEGIKGRIGHRNVWGRDGNMVGFGVTMQGQPLTWSLRGTHASTSVPHTVGQQWYSQPCMLDLNPGPPAC